MHVRIISTLIGVAVIFLSRPAQAQLAYPNDAGVSFGHVHMNVTDVELHKKLWSELFGGVVIEREGYVAVRLPGTLLFLRDAEPTAPSQGSAVDHFGFKVQDLATVLATWRSLGFDVDRELADESGSAVAYITTSDGATLELTQDAAIGTKAEMDHVHFSALHADSLIAWYQHMFGAVPQSRSGSDVAIEVPGSRLVFASSDVKRTPIEGGAIDHIGIEVENVESFAELLRDEGVEIEFGPRYFESLDLWVAFFTDDSGALIEITQGLDW